MQKRLKVMHSFEMTRRGFATMHLMILCSALG